MSFIHTSMTFIGTNGPWRTWVCVSGRYKEMALEKMISGHRTDLWREEDETVFHPLASY